MSDLKDICGPEDDIAILELDEYVSSDEAVPICLPSEHQQLVDPLQSAGAGRDGKHTVHLLFLEALTAFPEAYSRGTPSVLSSALSRY